MNTEGISKRIGYARFADYIAITSIIIFGILHCLQSLANNDYMQLLTRGIASAIAVFISILCMFFVKNTEKLAFYIPIVVSASFITSAILDGGISNFFLTIICILCLSSMYFSFKYYIRFVVLINAIIAVLVWVLRFPVLGPDSEIDSIYIGWFIMLVGTVFITVITQYSTSRNIKAVKSQDSFNAMLALTPNFMVIVDEQSRVTYISNALAIHSHIEHPQMSTGRPLIDLFHDLELKIMISEILETHGFYETTKEIHREGETYYYKVITDEMLGETKGRFIDISDVTSLVKAKIEAEQATRTKSAFLAKMSHEIRTPMNAITGMAELALREKISPTAHDQILTIKRSGITLVAIINDILDFSKIEAGKLEIVSSEYLLASLLNDVISIIRVRTVDKHIRFSVFVDSNIPGTLIGDEIKVRQILLNLLGNAVKYTDMGFIALKITGEIIDNNRIILTIEVSDSGKGIKDEDQERLFGEFVQFEQDRNKGIQGSGLGLAITRGFVKSMGGEISVHSEYGVGSVFTAVIPQNYSQYYKLANVENPEKKRVLLYERRSLYVDSIVSSVTNLGVSCTHVSDNSQLFNCLSDYEYPFVFVNAALYEGAKNILNTFINESTIILLSEITDSQTIHNLRMLSMPIYSVTIANILNGITDSFLFNKTQEMVIRFSAPTAKVLIVDDINTNLKVAEGLMLPYNMQIHLCISGSDAIAAVLSNRYDLIFMDHMMPGMDGIEAVKQIRNLDKNEPYYQNVPIVALTANAVSGMREIYLSNGFNDYLDKPIDFVKLNALLEKWIPREKQEKYAESNSESKETSFKIKDVDVNKGVSMTGGTEEGYILVLNSFYKDGIKKIAEIKASLFEGNLSLYVTYVHALKSASASIGADSFSEMAKNLEKAGIEKDYSYIDKHNEIFITHLEELLKNISYIISAYRPEVHDEVDSEKTVKPLLEKLKKALNEMDSEAIDVGVNSLNNMEISKETSLIVEEILQNTLIGEYDEAVKLIESLLHEL